MAKRPIPTPEELRQLLDYDPETGRITWRERPLEFCADRACWRRWNKSYSGKTAFNVAHCKGYLQGSLFSRVYLAHRVAWAIHYGEWPSEQIDHINGNRQDNSIANLRDVRQIENARNQKLRHDNVSGCPGVIWAKDRRKWSARLMVNGKNIYLGEYDGLEDAVAARKAADAQYGFHANHGRRFALKAK